MNPDCRQFLGSASAFTCAAFCGRVALGETFLAAPSPAANSELYGKALIAKMKWFNEPASAKRSGDQIVVTAKPKTDYWRKTFYDYVTDNGYFFFLPVTGHFNLEGRVVGKYAALDDQAGLKVRVDSGNWLKCGLELVDGIGHASVVVTRNSRIGLPFAASVQRNQCGGAGSAKALRLKSSILSMARTLFPYASAISHSKPPWMLASCAALLKVRASTLPSTKSV